MKPHFLNTRPPQADPYMAELLARSSRWNALGEYIAEMRRAGADLSPLFEEPATDELHRTAAAPSAPAASDLPTDLG